MKNQRVVYFDYLRIIAIFAVVVLHISGRDWSSADVNSATWQTLNLYNSATRWGVPVFVMMSGALFLGRGLTIRTMFRKYIFRMVIVFFFWSALYAVWQNLILLHNDSIGDLVMEILFGHYHMWFLFLIVGLYLAVPLLDRIVRDRKTAWYYVVLLFVFAFLIPQITETVGLFSGTLAATEKVFPIDLMTVFRFTFYFVLGYLLNETSLSKKQRRAIFTSGAIGLIFTAAFTAFASAQIQSPVALFLGNLTVNILFVSAAVFVFAKTHLNRPLSEAGLKRLTFLSKCSFGVYLVHPFLIEAIREYFSVTAMSFSPALSVPVLSLAVFAAATVISAALNTIPGVKSRLV